MTDKNKKRDLNKINDLIFRYWTSSGLKKNILELRKKYEIPEEGFFSRENTEELEEEDRKKAEEGYFKRHNWEVKHQAEVLDDLDVLISKYKLPPQAILLLKEYLCCGPLKSPQHDIENFPIIDIDLYPISRESNLLETWDQSGVPYVCIAIPSYASKKDVKSAIDKEWRFFEDQWKLQGWRPSSKRKRTIKDKDIKDRAIDLMEKPKSFFKDDLAKYKEMAVKNKLEKEFPKRKIPSSENIKMIYHKYRNRSKS